MEGWFCDEKESELGRKRGGGWSKGGSGRGGSGEGLRGQLVPQKKPFVRGGVTGSFQRTNGNRLNTVR